MPVTAKDEDAKDLAAIVEFQRDHGTKHLDAWFSKQPALQHLSSNIRAEPPQLGVSALYFKGTSLASHAENLASALMNDTSLNSPTSLILRHWDHLHRILDGKVESILAQGDVEPTKESRSRQEGTCSRRTNFGPSLICSLAPE